MRNDEFISCANQILRDMQLMPSLEKGLELSKLILTQISASAKDLDLSNVKDRCVVDVVGIGNTKMESWFKPHPYLGGHLTAFDLYVNQKRSLEAKFYHLNDSATKRIVAGSVQLLPNWEDNVHLTRNADWKVGIDFFLSGDCKSLLFVLSLEGNLRILEFSERISNTQVQIIEKISGAGDLETQEAIHGVLWNALAIREVNKEFYGGVAELFEELLQALKSKGHPIEDSKIFASRLIGRLLFIWFLRRKGFIQREEYFKPEGKTSTDFYENQLKHLFFQVLSTPIENRKSGVELDTPYLNGGLFEVHSNDWTEEKIQFPSKYFDRVFRHFENFNFTTDESSPDYEQIAIDPEMLGRVFESLLATQLTESGDSARKAKGAFYTPREVVTFMCKETLRNYLYSRINNPAFNAGIDKLIDTSDAHVAKAHSNFIRDLWGKENAKLVIPEIIDAIHEIRIIDPACGSGAFPLGMVQLLTKTLERLDSKFDAHNAKLRLIQNCIFGVDIEPMAIEIAKLRTWLALIVEKDENSKVDPLPNLDFKYVCANSLISLSGQHDGFDFGVDQSLNLKLAEIRSNYFSTSDLKEKENLKKNYYALTETAYAADIDKRIKQLRTFNPFDVTQAAKFFDPVEMFGIERFDVVIGNPPYLGEKNHKDIFKELKNSSIFDRFYEGRADLFHYFFHLGIDLLKDKGILAFITTNYFPTATYGSNLRNDIFDRTNVLQIVNFQETKLFESALGQHNMITVLRRSDRKENYSCMQTIVNSKGVLSQNELVQILTKTSPHINVGRLGISDLFDDSPKRYLRFISSDELNSIVLRIAGIRPLLGDLVNINQGVISGIDRFTAGWKKKFPKIGAETGHPVFVFGKDESSFPHLRPWYKSSDLSRYVVSRNSRYEILWLGRGGPTPTKSELKHLEVFKPLLQKRGEFRDGRRKWYELHRARDESIFTGPKIVNPYRTYDNYFAYSEEEIFGGPDLTFITNREDVNIDLFFLLGLLNSDLIYMWFYLRGKRKGEALELFPVPVSEVPIARDKALEKKIAQLSMKAFKLLSTGERTEVNDIQLEINELVFELYQLSLEEVKAIQEFVEGKSQVRQISTDEDLEE